jgi:prevent-host-death family protein
MLNTSMIPARSLQKSYKAIIREVKTKKSTVVLTTNNKPQAAIVSLSDLEELKLAKAARAGLDMLKVATESRQDLKSLPANLRQSADDLLYGKQH